MEAEKSRAFFFLPGHEVDRVAFVASLGPRVRLVAMVAGFHGGPVGPGAEGVVFDVTVAIEAQGLLVGMKLVGYIYDPDIL